MGDERLRQLERQWLESSDMADEVRWVEERIRTGELTLGRAWIAGYLGHKASRQILGLERGDPEIIGVDLDPLSPNLTPVEYDLVRLHGAAIAIRGASVTWERARNPDSARDQALIAVREWLACPCESCAVEVKEQLSACQAARESSTVFLCQAVLASESSERNTLVGGAMGLATMMEIRVDRRFSRWEPDDDSYPLRNAWRRELVPLALRKEPWPESL